MNTALIMPVFVQVALTFFLLFRTALMRVGETKKQPDLIATGAVDTTVYSKKARQTANSFANQLETPILFYAVVLFALILNVDIPMLLPLAWAYVAARLVHMFIHIGPNVVLPRFLVFLVSVLILITMWVLLGLAAL